MVKLYERWCAKLKLLFHGSYHFHRTGTHYEKSFGTREITLGFYCIDCKRLFWARNKAAEELLRGLEVIK